MVVERVLIVRHGETDYNVQRRWQGQLDVELNATGKQQAEALAETLLQSKIDAVYSSDLRRAADTASIIAAPHRLSVLHEPGLREINVGVFQGLNRQEIDERYPYEMYRWNNDDHYVPQGGESRFQLQERAFAAWNSIIQREHRNVLLVSHGGTIRLLLRRVLPHMQIDGLRFANTSLTILNYTQQSGWVAERIADATHL
ncbi:MAG: histidine phosphatase family protein [Anaerolineae bacterium]|nr:histidine phosphatase family protein [Anaerolineae bacterium]